MVADIVEALMLSSRLWLPAVEKVMPEYTGFPEASAPCMIERPRPSAEACADLAPIW
jgi:hypothetical protein